MIVRSRLAQKAIGDRTVGALERLATALYVTKRQAGEHDGSVESRAKRINKLKPHVSVEAATEAVKEVDSLIARLAGSES